MEHDVTEEIGTYGANDPTWTQACEKSIGVLAKKITIILLHCPIVELKIVVDCVALGARRILEEFFNSAAAPVKLKAAIH